MVAGALSSNRSGLSRRSSDAFSIPRDRRKIIRGRQTEFRYARDVQPTPKPGVWVDAGRYRLDALSIAGKNEPRTIEE